MYVVMYGVWGYQSSTLAKISLRVEIQIPCIELSGREEARVKYVERVQHRPEGNSRQERSVWDDEEIGQSKYVCMPGSSTSKIFVESYR